MNNDLEAVIKVTYQGSLRRFNLLVKKDGSFDLDMAGLKTKICNLFNLAHDAGSNLILTYKDEDGESVHLVDDIDLCDAIKQHIDPLRISAYLKTDHCGWTYESRGRGWSPCTEKPKPIVPAPPKVSILSSSDEVVSKRDQKSLAKLVDDLASKVASAVPVKFRDLVIESVVDSSDDLIEFAKSVSKLGIFDVVEDEISKEKEKDKENSMDGLKKPEESQSAAKAEDNGGNMNTSVSTSKLKDNGKISTKESESDSSDRKSNVPASPGRIRNAAYHDFPNPARIRNSSSYRNPYGGPGFSNPFPYGYSPTNPTYYPTSPSDSPC